MDGYQRQEAIDLLAAITEVDYYDIDCMEDHELAAWLYELGYDWDASVPPFGAWVVGIEGGEVQP